MALVLKTSDVKASVGSNPTSPPRALVQFGRTSLWEREVKGSNPFMPDVINIW